MDPITAPLDEATKQQAIAWYEIRLAMMQMARDHQDAPPARAHLDLLRGAIVEYLTAEGLLAAARARGQ